MYYMALIYMVSNLLNKLKINYFLLFLGGIEKSHVIKTNIYKKCKVNFVEKL